MLALVEGGERAAQARKFEQDLWADIEIATNRIYYDIVYLALSNLIQLQGIFDFIVDEVDCDRNTYQKKNLGKRQFVELVKQRADLSKNQQLVYMRVYGTLLFLLLKYTVLMC